MDNQHSDRDNQQSDDQSKKSSHESNTQDSHNNQDNTNNAFSFSSFGQQYLDQLNQVNQFNQSLFNQSSQTSNPFEANLKLWQDSINNFGSFMMPNATGNVGSQKSDSWQNDKDKDQQTEQNADDDTGDFNELTQKFFSETLKRVGQDNNISQSLMLNIIDGWQRFNTGVTEKSPTALVEQQRGLWQKQFQLYQNTLMKGAENQTKPLVTPEKGDKRFTDEEWTNNPIFNFLKQSYLLTVNGMMDTIDNTEGVDEKNRQRLSFFTRQWLNAIAPSNFPWSNPEILRLTMESKGQNLVRGLKQLTEDMEKSSKLLSIRMTDNDAFRLGENIATTPGKVVFRNRMFELIQYNPTTAKVNKRP
ncbi:MAG TPA: hypothetical protein VLN09_05735, partial [Psychrobacter sp.]|nr:hypothetical protein [Psychrobacter sp.]